VALLPGFEVIDRLGRRLLHRAVRQGWAIVTEPLPGRSGTTSPVVVDELAARRAARRQRKSLPRVARR
jgi:hypothetical protein